MTDQHDHCPQALPDVLDYPLRDLRLASVKHGSQHPRTEPAPAEAGERALLPDVLQRVSAGHLWIADRQISTAGFLLSVQEKAVAFMIRRHAKLACEEIGRRSSARRRRGEVSELQVRVRGEGSKELALRQVRVRLEKPTRDKAQNSVS